MFDASIIIVSWNTRDILQDCLKSISEQAGDIDYETIVVDNASADGSAEMVREKFPSVILIENSSNCGFAAANNQAMRIAKGRYILLLNSDTLILDRAIEKTISFADAHPEVAVTGCRVLNSDKSLQPTCFMFPSILNMVLSSSYLYKLFPGSKFFGRERMTWWDRSDTREVDVVTGCFILVRPQAIEQVGMMDEQFFVYGEETDWCYRFKQSGWKVIFTPEAEIIHLGGASSKQIRPEMQMQLKASILLFMKKHRKLVSYYLGCIVTSLFFSARVPYWLGIALVSKNSKEDCWLTTKTYLSASIRSLTGWSALSFRKQTV